MMTVILLSISFGAAQCEIKCELAQTLPSCHGSSAPKAQTQQPMDEMPGMEHKVSSDQEVSAPTVVATAPACKVHACAQQPAIFSKQKAAVAHVSVRTEAVFFEALQIAPEPLEAGLSSRGPPRLRRSTPITLRTTLRV